MKPLRLACAATIAGAMGLAALWLRERRAKTVFPASQAGMLLHPARRLIQPAERVVDAFGIGEGHRVLEIGPGPGYFTSAAARAGGERGRVVCLDLQLGMLEQLRLRLQEEIRLRVRMLAGDATRLPFADRSFDRAFLVSVLGEVPDPGGALVELRRILRPDAIVSFAESLTDPDYVRQADLRRLCRHAGLRFVDSRRQPLGYIMRFSRPE